MTMKPLFSSPLARHIIAALLIKAIALVGLWSAFVLPQKKKIDGDGMAQRLVTSPISQSSKEDSNDDRSHRR
ncbi:cytochrome oxidase putative small subunit CydP [Sulfuricystis thermophila]|uniref:cytochrome oxidase putative small subunit CydP n=1 Tax=Sulfuricystis thermophila TaxID=2496847 RepID=UPI0010363D50|nr:cytochrome oxidase putative small subunit CydP [Sulfuricystis thermophila]